MIRNRLALCWNLKGPAGREDTGGYLLRELRWRHTALFVGHDATNRGIGAKWQEDASRNALNGPCKARNSRTCSGNTSTRPSCVSCFPGKTEQGYSLSGTDAISAGAAELVACRLGQGVSSAGRSCGTLKIGSVCTWLHNCMRADLAPNDGTGMSDARSTDSAQGQIPPEPKTSEVINRVRKDSVMGFPQARKLLDSR